LVKNPNGLKNQRCQSNWTIHSWQISCSDKVFIGKAILIISIYLSCKHTYNLIDKLIFCSKLNLPFGGSGTSICCLDSCIRYDVLLKFHGFS
jgi:hypothetical protein